jgi:hypothetical protein
MGLIRVQFKAIHYILDEVQVLPDKCKLIHFRNEFGNYKIYVHD